MNTLNNNSIIKISFFQLFLLTLAQAGGASILYIPGLAEAGNDVWISNIIASIVGYIVIFSHYIPLSQRPDLSLTEIYNAYWGKFVGGIVSLFYVLYFFLLCCLIVSDVFYFGKITMPETPGYIFIIFFIIPPIYGVKLGLETLSRLLEFLLPIFIVIYCSLFLMVFPKLDFTRLLPLLPDGIKPVIAGAIPNMNFPYAQLLPLVYFYKYSNINPKGKAMYLKSVFWGILLSTILLTLRSIASASAFGNDTLMTLTYPPFSTIRLIEIGEVLERLDALFLAVFYVTTFFKFSITYFVICEIISDYFKVGSPKDYALPVALLIGVSMPFLIPRFDVILQTVVPYFFISMPLFFPIPLMLYCTMRLKRPKSLSK